MAAKLSRLGNWVIAREWPRAACPVCAEGGLAMTRTKVEWDNETRRAFDLAKWDESPVDELSGTFSGTLECDDAQCGASVSVAGEWARGAWDADEDGVHFEEMYRVRFVIPALRLLYVPEQTPEIVREEVAAAEAVLFASAESAVSRLRSAVEAILDQHEVARRSAGGRFLSLERRLAAFKQTNSDVGEMLSAVRHFGNTGTHGETITVEMVEESAEILGRALGALYGSRQDAVLERVRQVNANRGPHVPGQEYPTLLPPATG